MKSAQSQADQNTRTLHLHSPRLASVGKMAAGFGICTLCAVAMVLFLRSLPFVTSLPFAFLLVVALVAHWFGTSSAILGLFAAATVFARFLFPPLGSFSITDAPARTNVVLMLLFGLAVAYFYGASNPDRGSHDDTAPSL